MEDQAVNQLKEQIMSLKKNKDVAILAHYYTEGVVQEVADYVGDSYYLSKLATELSQKTIMLCGVFFMGESIKILNPEKTILMPDLEADCPMAHMVDIQEINKKREEYEDLAVVCYINSTAEIKAHADVIVTSSNAIKILKALPNKNIFFIPDENLGRYVAKQVPEKNFIFNDGFCHVHANLSRASVENIKAEFPEAVVLAHPECKEEVLDLANYIGSTSGIINYATESPATEFIVCTEIGILHELNTKNPNKVFYVKPDMVCPNMKKITLEKICQQLNEQTNVMEVSQEVRKQSIGGLDRMLELAK